MAEPSSSHRDDRDLVLLARGPAWGLPTACPYCLPAYIYLKLAQVDFSIFYNDVSPDADHLPALEYGDLVAYSDESGGIIALLESQGVANLDSGLSENEIALVRCLSAMVWLHLHSMLLCELWDLDNSKVAQQIYFSSLPWPLNKILHWKEQGRIWQQLGLQKGKIKQVNKELERKATEAYQSMSILLDDKKFFLGSRPSSLDALFLSHALFIMHAPLENSYLKEELSRHSNLIRYVEDLRTEVLDVPGTAPLAKSVYVKPSRTPKAPQRRQEPAQRSEKVKNAKWRTKCFLAAQAVSVLMFLYIWGNQNAIELDDDDDVYEYE